MVTDVVLASIATETLFRFQTTVFMSIQCGSFANNLYDSPKARSFMKEITENVPLFTPMCNVEQKSQSAAFSMERKLV